MNTQTEHRDINDLEGRVALVTGAGTGIGLATATRLTAAGASVYGLCIAEDQREAFADAVGGDQRFVQLDISDADAVATTIAGIGEREGHVDVLVNNAGIRDIGSALELPPAEWQRVIDVDLSGGFYCAQAAGRLMAAQGSGSIINISSLAGLVGFAERTAYTVAKTGVIGLTRVLAAELGPMGIRVNAVCPGMIETPMTRSYITEAAVARSIKGLVPLGYAGATSTIADVVLFLAGDGARYVTGAAIPVDGGFSASATWDPYRESTTFTKTHSVLAETDA